MRSLFILVFLFASKTIFAVEAIEMADTLRSNGKIYIVVSILLIILVGFFAYLASVDKKVNSIFNKLNHK